MLSDSAKAGGFSMMVVMPAMALLGLLTMATFHLVLDQRHRT
ncbi:pilus assembly protein PilZ, partial [Klebsiella michiganensis]